MNPTFDDRRGGRRHCRPGACLSLRPPRAPGDRLRAQPAGLRASRCAISACCGPSASRPERCTTWRCAAASFWLEVLAASGLWHEQTGSLHLAYRDDEAQVLAEFAEPAAADGYECQLLSAGRSRRAQRRPSRPRACWRACGARPKPASTRGRSSPSCPAGSRASLACISSSARPSPPTSSRTVHGRRRALGRPSNCSSARAMTLHTLYPEAFAGVGFLRCKLQMMRSQAYGARFSAGTDAGRRLDAAALQEFSGLPDARGRQAARGPRERPSSTATAFT